MQSQTIKTGRSLIAALALSLTGSIGFAADTQYYVNDPLATTVAITDAAGEIAAIEADAFGAPLAAGEAPSRYTGKPYDADLGAYVFPFRNYRPEEGRWMSADPSGFPDGVNGTYYAAMLFDEVDPFGLFTILAQGPLTSLSIQRPDNSIVVKTYRIWGGQTAKGRKIALYKLEDTNNESGIDFAFNCHGWTFTGGVFWIKNIDAAKIIADEYQSTSDPSKAKIASFNGFEHTGTVELDETISNKWGSSEGVRNDSVNTVSSAYGEVKYYE